MKQNINTTVVMELRVISKQFQYTDQEQAVIHTKKVSFRTQIQFKYMQLLPSCYIFLNSKTTRGKKPPTNNNQKKKNTLRRKKKSLLENKGTWVTAKQLAQYPGTNIINLRKYNMIK